jgi:hypothetical protein
MNVFECIYSIFECNWMHLNILECIHSIFQCISIYLKVFEYLSVYLNVFIDIIIGISPSHFHCNVFAIYTHLYICFLLSTMTPFPTCFTTTLFSHVSIDPFQLSYNL